MTALVGAATSIASYGVARQTGILDALVNGVNELLGN